MGTEKSEVDKDKKTVIINLAQLIGGAAAIFVGSRLMVNNATAILNMVLYTINIYFDFSGCMDIVCGVSELFGIKLPQNFRQPFFSENIQEFWRRWHITLGDWIKKYIFYSVSMSKCNQRSNPNRVIAKERQRLRQSTSTN
ncbi:MAG: hypothetical protein KBT46_06995 [Ruminococcus sp.]|nr:hypothetical protein [Candidatus Copronaster equi]